jgi:hypothetical protein
MRVKIKIKNKLEGKNKFFIGGLNWKKITKEQKNQKNKNQIRKKIHHKLGLNDEIEIHQNFYKRAKGKN